MNSFYENISEELPSFDAESSFYFLKDYLCYKNWHLYSSTNYSFEIVEHLCKYFCSLHGQVFLTSNLDPTSTVWSSKPLGVFRYRMDKENFWQEIGYLNKITGYLVEGAYWANGFFYQVLDNKKIIELKLFVDENTSIRYNYPHTPHRSI